MRGRRDFKRGGEPDDHALGRSRGGFTTKIHLLCDRRGHPLHFKLTAGQAHESQSLVDLLEGACGPNEPLVYPVKIAGDRGYRANWIDGWLKGMGVRPVVPPKSTEGRAPREFDKAAYRQRNVVERLIGWLKESRRVLTRFEKKALNFAAVVKTAFIHRYLRTMCRERFSDRA